MLNLFKKKISINVWLLPILVIGIVALTLISVFWGMHKLTHNAGGTLQFLYTLGKIRSSYVHARSGGKPGRSLFGIYG